MTQRQATILGWLTLIALLAALWILFGEDPNRQQGGRGEALYTDFDEAISSIVDVELVGPEGATTLSLTDAGWSVAERSGYRADTSKIVGLMRALVRSTRREPKTTRKARFSDIGLGDDKISITLKSTSGDAVVPALDIGTRSEGATGRSLTYVFKASDTRAWLVTDLPSISTDPADWIDTALGLLQSDMIADVRYPDVTLSRDATGQLVAADLADGETMSSEFLRRDLLRLFDGLAVEDVQALANPLTEPEVAVSATDADGRTVTLTLFVIDDAPWVQITAAGADDITAATRGWMFAVSTSDASILRRTRGSYVTTPAPVPASAPASDTDTDTSSPEGS